jgi:hypothetical protein
MVAGEALVLIGVGSLAGITLSIAGWRLLSNKMPGVSSIDAQVLRLKSLNQSTEPAMRLKDHHLRFLAQRGSSRTIVTISRTAVMIASGASIGIPCPLSRTTT